MVQLSHPWMTRRKTTALMIWSFVGEVMSLFFNTLSRFVIAFLPRNKQLLISWLQSPSAVILEPKKRKSVTVSIVCPSFCMKWWDRMPWSLFTECWVSSQLFHFPLSLSSRGSLVPLHFLTLVKHHLHIWGHLESHKLVVSGRDWGQEEKGTTEDEMAGWHHRLDGHEFG